MDRFLRLCRVGIFRYLYGLFLLFRIWGRGGGSRGRSRSHSVLSATSNFSKFKRLSSSMRGQDIGRAPEPFHIAPLGAFWITQLGSAELWPGWPSLPSSPLSCHSSPGNLLGEGVSSALTPPDRVGQPTIHPSLAVWWVVRRQWLVSGPVSGLQSHRGAGVGIKTPSTNQAPYSFSSR